MRTLTSIFREEHQPELCGSASLWFRRLPLQRNTRDNGKSKLVRSFPRNGTSENASHCIPLWNLAKSGIYRFRSCFFATVISLWISFYPLLSISSTQCTYRVNLNHSGICCISTIWNCIVCNINVPNEHPSRRTVTMNMQGSTQILMAYTWGLQTTLRYLVETAVDSCICDELVALMAVLKTLKLSFC